MPPAPSSLFIEDHGRGWEEAGAGKGGEERRGVERPVIPALGDNTTSQPWFATLKLGTAPTY